MINHGKVQSMVKPIEMEVLATKVFVSSNIKKTTQTIEDSKMEVYEFNLIEYDKDEYLKFIDEKNKQLEEKNTQLDESLTETQMALCDIYESMGI